MADTTTKKDISRIKYNVVAILSSGNQINLDEVATNIAWEENESELATRLNITIRDVEVNGKRLASQIALCTAVLLYYDDGDGYKEAFRGTVWEWSHSGVKDDEIIITAYDMLFYLQKSEDYGFYPAGKTTQQICHSILNDWGVPIGVYSAPSINHEKEVLKSKKISALLTEILKKAELMTGARGIIRANQGKCDIIKFGTNSEIWTFSADTNLMSVSDKYSMTDLITRVTILGKEDTDGESRPPVFAVRDGQTQYGTLQKIISIGSATEEAATQDAENTLKESGKPKRRITLIAPDFPRIRKGDRIRLVTDMVDGYFFVMTISHNATNQQMQMEVEQL